MAGDEVLLR